jgi:outer membrane protein assembly factor BamB
MSRLTSLAVVNLLLAATLGLLPAAPVPRPADGTSWPMYGGGPSRNMVNRAAAGVPDDFDPATGWRILWAADIGSRTYAQPVVAGGVVLVGTNNEKPRNRRDTVRNADGEWEPIDRGVLMCFRAADGKFLWQAVHDKLPSGQVNDWPNEGVASAPAVDGGRAYYVSNRAEVVCVDLNGFADGNQGFDREKYQTDTDADVIWSFDMIGELRVFPHNLAQCSPLVVGDRVFVVTGNGVDEGHINIPEPAAPSFLALDKATGKLLWKSSLPGKNILHGQWSSPAYAAAPVPQVIFPGGDGWLYALDPATGALLWKFDCNPKDAKYELGGTGTRNDFIAMPVIHAGRLYIGTGQDPEHFTGVGHFWCIDLAKAVAKGRANVAGDVSPVTNDFDPAAAANRDSALVWHYGGDDRRQFVPRDFVFGRTMSAACVVGDVLYAAELQGLVHCLDARTGQKYWQYDTKGAIWGGPYYADGKVFLATEAGDLFVFRHDPRPSVMDELDVPDAANQKDFRMKALAVRREVERTALIRKIEFETTFRSTPAVAGGVLYLNGENKLYAIRR